MAVKAAKVRRANPKWYLGRVKLAFSRGGSLTGCMIIALVAARTPLWDTSNFEVSSRGV